MTGIRSVTLGTENIDKTIELFHNMIGMRYHQKAHSVQLGDGHLQAGTRLQFVEIPKALSPDQSHFKSIGLRTPTNEGLKEYINILNNHQIHHSDELKINHHLYFYFHDFNGQRFDLYSNEMNSGVPLGVPDDNDIVNPLHQVQGLGPIVLCTNEVMVTLTLLTKIFNFRPFAKYQNHKGIETTVLQRGEGGLGAEIHLYQPEQPIQLPEYGIIEQLEFTAQHQEEFYHAMSQLKQHDIPYHTLKSTENHTESIRVNDISGISFILTLDKEKDD
ncbi:VOC family protein [Staphylococcus canis]|uniref:VOC family protein n=1 Tax=Staphylococcus canis TaxID=2724942 RepID=A0ABS0TBV7_9STAP|nr:VOC family protein [Staphylococcus canis]MBI5975456.1 VOC family protein [Staphylococcus canis]